jgi:hypothetical protein
LRASFRLIPLLLTVLACSDAGYDLVIDVRGLPESSSPSHIEVVLGVECREQVPGGPFVGVERTLRLERSSSAHGVFGSVPSGDFGLAARGLRECSTVAYACRDVTLQADGSGRLELALTPFAGLGCAGTCADGWCEAVDASAPKDADPSVVPDAPPREEGCEPGSPCVTDAGVGTCYQSGEGDGICCTGCWDGVACRPGSSREACGSNGRLCEDCVGETTCCPDEGRCRTAC